MYFVFFSNFIVSCVDIGRLRKMVSGEDVKEVHWADSKLHLLDSLTKKVAATLKLSEVLEASKLRNE